MGCGLQQALGLASAGGQNGKGGIGSDPIFPDTGKINTLEKPVEGAGKTRPVGTRGQRQKGSKEDAYIEIKGPATTGYKSSVPYSEVLPKYKRQAEKSIKKGKIPKEHEKRVRQYFESLEGK